MAKHDWFFVTALLIFAAGLSLAGIDFGQPLPQYASSTDPYQLLPAEAPIHPDEYQFIAIPLQMLAENHFRTGYLVNPTLLTNLNLITFWATGAARALPLDDRASIDFIGRQYAPFNLYIIGRVYSALAGVLTVAGVYATARLLVGRRGALAAGLLTAVSYTLVQHAHYATPNSLAAACAMLAVWASFASLRTRQRSLFWLASTLAGLAASSRYNAAAVFIVVFLVGLILLIRRHQTIKVIFFGWLLFPLAFLIGTPYALVERREFLEGVLYGFQHYLGSLDNDFVFGNGLFYELRHLIVFALGVPASLMVIAGVYSILGTRRSERSQHKNLFISIVLFYVAAYAIVVLRSGRLGSDQLLIPIIPPLALLAGVGLSWIYDYLRINIHPLINAGIMLVFMLVPLSLSVQLARLFSLPDTRIVMQTWVYDHLPRGSRIHLNGPYNVPLDSADYHWTQTYAGNLVDPDMLLAENVDYMILSGAWYDLLVSSREVVPGDYLQNVLDYLTMLSQRLPRVAYINRPMWTGSDWGVHNTARYWHHPGLTVYCLAACIAQSHEGVTTATSAGNFRQPGGHNTSKTRR